MLRTSETHYHWDKGDEIALSPHFNTREFSCHCQLAECGEQRVARVLIDRLEVLRNIVGSLRITCGRRCNAHQEELARQGLETSKGVSRHVDPCDAADIALLNGAPVTHELSERAGELFNGCGVARSFVHVDCRPNVTRWGYAKS